MVDMQIVDISIVIRAQAGKILAEVEVVGACGLCKLGKGQIVLQVKLRFLAVPLQRQLDVIGQVRHPLRLRWLASRREARKSGAQQQ